MDIRTLIEILTGRLIDMHIVLCWDWRKNRATDVGSSNKFCLIKRRFGSLAIPKFQRQMTYE